MEIKVDIADIYKDVRKYISENGEDLLLQVNKDLDKSKITIFIFGKDNKLEYLFNKVWYIYLDYNYGYLKSLGKIKSSTEVDLEDFFKKLPKTLRDHIEEINKIFKSSLAPNSIKFIKSKIKEKISSNKDDDSEIKGIDDLDSLVSDLKKVDGDKKVSDDTFHVYDVNRYKREIAISISNNANLDYYSQKDGSWRIFSNYLQGSHYMIGTIHSYDKVTLKDSEIANFPKNYLDLIKEFNDVFKEHMKPNSIKFITSKKDDFNIDKVYNEVKDLVTKEVPTFILSVEKSSSRPYIFLYMNGSNHLDYEFKDGEWVIHLDLNYGHRKVLGKIKSYKDVSIKEELWKDIPKQIRDFIDDLNKIFKESLKTNSIKFITSKVIEKLAKIRKIDTKDIFIGRSAIYDTMTDIEEGRTSRSSGPLKVYHLSEGEHKGRYLLADGYHRLFVFLLNHKTKVDVDVIGYGGGANTDIAIPYKTFSIDPSLKFMGLEDLADEDILEDLKEKLKK